MYVVSCMYGEFASSARAMVQVQLHRLDGKLPSKVSYLLRYQLYATLLTYTHRYIHTYMDMDRIGRYLNSLAEVIAVGV